MFIETSRRRSPSITPLATSPRNVSSFRIRQVAHDNIGANGSRPTNLECTCSPDTENVGQRDPYMLPVGNIYSCDACHISPSTRTSSRTGSHQELRHLLSALPLFVTRILAYDALPCPLRRITLQLRHSRFTDARTFIVSSLLPLSGNTSSTVSLEVGLLQESFILMRHHMRLYLRHEIHRDYHNNEERCSTEIERYVPTHNHETLAANTPAQCIPRRKPSILSLLHRCTAPSAPPGAVLV